MWVIIGIWRMLLEGIEGSIKQLENSGFAGDAVKNSIKLTGNIHIIS